MPRPTSDVAPPALAIPGFTLGEELGKGGFSVVWSARREDDGAPAAVKIGRTRGAVLIERFRREADALARVGPPHAPLLYRSGDLEDGRPYLVMERLFGRTLAEELHALRAPPGVAWASRRIELILAALEAAHARGITHRDLKPANIFVTVARAGDQGPGDAGPLEERAVLLDFGLACGALLATGPGAELTRPGMTVGTPAYMAPEQLQGDAAVDERADIYGIGVILFELFTLRTPFLGDNAAVEQCHLAQRPPRPSELAPVPPELDDLTLACLAKDPARRPQSVAALRRALAEARAALSQPRASAAMPSASGLVAASGQPAVLLVAETSAAAPPILAAIAGRGGFVARRRGNRYVGIFTAPEAEDPAYAAFVAARALVERHGARVALHLTRVTLRHREQGPPAVYGAPVDRPEAWLPAEPWSGLRCTAEIEPLLGDAARAIEEAERTAAGAPPLVGHAALRAALAASAAAAFDGACPGLFTVLGDDGLGKSRFAAEAADAGFRSAAEARVVSLRAAPCAAEAGLSSETAALLRWVLDGDAERAPPPRRDLVRTLAEGLRRRARERPVAVILDDAHRADDALLDALEYATLDGEGVRLWVVVVAHPRFLAQRPTWGARTQRNERASLAPLDEAAGASLAAFLLRPADYPPMEALRRVVAFAGGNPACLVDVVRSLQRAGAIRRRPSGRGYELAMEALDELPPSAPQQWLASRRLSELPAALAALARVAAVLGPAFTEDELAAVLDGLERAGSAGSPLDAGVGLSALAAAGVVTRTEGARWSFPSAVLREALEALVDPAHRAEVHRKALAYVRPRAASAGPLTEPLEAVARHAAGCGERAEAARAQIALGDAALCRHRHVEADLRYSSALSLLDAGDALSVGLRARSLAGRGRARYRVQRGRAAREDFTMAIALFEALGDLRQKAEILLEDATALDWDQQFEASARRVEEARAIIDGLADARLTVRLRVAEGRTCHRRKEESTSVALLEEAIAEAAALGDGEPRVVALLLLSFQLASMGRLEEAELRFEEVIALAEATGDLPHLGVAYINRVALWIARGLPERAIGDLHRAAAIAREIGNPWLEHAATHNVALMLYWSDAQVEALALARRACLLSERAVEAPASETRLLLCEILLMLEQHEEAARILEAMRASGFRPAPDDVPRHQMLLLVLSELSVARAAYAQPIEGGWEQTMQLAEETRIHIETVLRLLYWRARMALAGGRVEEATAALEAVERRRRGRALWPSRFEALSAELREARRAAHERALAQRRAPDGTAT